MMQSDNLEYISKVRNINVEHRESLTSLEKLALFTTDKVGSMGFFFIILIWTLVWILWNTYAPKGFRFDPFPGFILWLFISNVLQLVLLPLIMVGQNLQSRHAEARAEADFELNVQAEKEIKILLRHMEKQNNLMLEILRRLDESREAR
ncbi:MAG TPA: DUF1003 domain-containing protein [Candidatus Andersenbacteria bacterium]|nr:DUF1003 domain-containing protein [Candidatus Andersenbacteria bacterium]